MKPQRVTLLQVCCLALFAVFIGAVAGAQETPFLLKDIHPSGSSAPTELLTVGSTTFFAADDGAKGVELWKTDGTAGGTVLVKDICPGSCSSTPLLFEPLGSTLFFVASNGSTGQEVWKSDGTAAGTVLVKDIYPGSSGSGVSSLTASGGQVFFTATDSVYGLELWRTDGTTVGTVMVKDIVPGGSQSIPSGITAVGSTVYFAALTALGSELWKSDGTADGTVLVKDINTGSGSSVPNGFTAVGNTVFFAAWNFLGMELWKSDGTTGGTVLVKDINPGGGHSFPSSLVELDGTLYFVADDGSTGEELWKSDGTSGGTILVKDIDPGSDTSGATELTSTNNLLFFSADSGGGGLGRELWRSNGTAGGTYALDVNIGAGSSSPSDLRAVGAELFFSADDGIHGHEPWKSNGSTTDMIDDIAPFAADSSPSEPTAAPAVILFAADDGQDGRELWAIQTSGPALDLIKTFTTSTVEAGTSGHTLDLEVTNTGTASASDVRITDDVDTRLTVTAVSPSAECSASSGQFVDCTFSTLAPAASQTVTVTYSVDAAVTPATVFNIAEAGDGVQLVEASDTVDVLQGSELGLTKTFTESSVESGTSGHSFTLVVSNTGNSEASDVRVTDSVDARLTVTSISPSAECAASSGQFVDCTFATLAPSASEIVTVSYSVDAAVAPATVSNTADAGDGAQLVEASDTVDVFRGPELGLTKTFTASSVEVGTSGHTFTLRVSNTGASAATDVQVTDNVDSRLTVTSVSPAAECSASSGQFVDCTFATVGSGASKTVTVTYAVGAAAVPGTVLNTAEASDGVELVQASDSVTLFMSCGQMPSHLDVTDEVIENPGFVAEACVSVDVGPSVHVMAGADPIFRAGETVTFYNGFELDSGGELVVINF